MNVVAFRPPSKTRQSHFRYLEIISLAHLVNRNAADALLFRMVKDGDIERIKRGRYCLSGASEDVPENMRKMRKKERSEPKPWKEQVDNGQSNDLTHLTQVSDGEEFASAEIANTDYLGPPGDDPADLDIPTFLRR